MDITDAQFEALINEAMDELPEEYIKRLDNVAIVYENEPTPDQREKLRLKCNESLFGLYEGIPLTKRGNNYNLVLPDKITIFKKPMIDHTHNYPALKAQVKHTLWHEIAHYFGLDHDRIHGIEGHWRS
ncbi:metallopeptidase family protein [soil metagenome]